MRSICILMAGVVLLPLAGCTQHDLKNVGPDPWFCCGPVPGPKAQTRNVDLLFVIDNSGSMADEQARLRGQFPEFMQELRAMAGGLPNLHIGVATTDLGTGMFSITYCEQAGGDLGTLQTGNCTNPTGGAPYIVDVRPQSCNVIREEDNTCSSHDCSQANCAHEPTSTYVQDATTGCPRCRNYSGESLEEVFSCVADVGTMGCGFEQPLEAMYKALDTNNTANSGFVREDALLSVVLITDEDDCSAYNPQLFDNTQTDMDSTLGPLSSYRCFEHGITCDVNSRLPGQRRDCVPRDDAATLLHHLSRYTQFLQALKDPQMLVLSAIAGPVTASEDQGYDATVSLDASGYPELDFSCANAENGAVPAIRIHSLVSAFQPAEALNDWAYSSVCADSYAGTLTGVGQHIATLMSANCSDVPLRGCSDVGVEFGSPAAAQTCAINSQCLAECLVSDVFERGLPSEATYEVPPCLEVGLDGTLLPGNTNRALAYATGHPEERDTDLPVAACWHIGYDASCRDSNFAKIVISRKADPPPRSFSEISCLPISQQELLCNDGEDNDEDCLVDAEDPDCE